MAGDATIREVTLRLPMLPDMEIEACKTATTLAEEMRMSPDKIDEVRMAVVEACINAFEHSNSSDREVHLRVAILGQREPEKLCITVQDSGVGFSPEELETPNMEQKIKSSRKRGWGLTIIRGLMDEVSIDSSSSGTKVVMCKLR